MSANSNSNSTRRALTNGPLTFLVVATEWDSGHGGLSTFNRELCCALSRLGHQVFCGVPTATPDVIERARTVGVKVVAPPALPGSKGFGSLYRPFNGVDDVDVVIGHGRITGPYALAQVADRFHNSHYVHFVHMDAKAIEWHKDDNNTDPAITAEDRVNLEKDLGLRASLIAAVGPELQEKYSCYFHSEERYVHEFLPGLFPSTWNKLPPKEMTCLIFGRTDDAELKGINLAARAMGKVCESFRSASLVVRGAPPGEGGKQRENLQKLSGKAVVVVAPFTADANAVRDAIRSASVVLMASRQEGFGLSGLEAISEGIPVLLSHRSGLARALMEHLPAHARDHIVDVQNQPDENEHLDLAARIVDILNDRDSAFDRVHALRDAMREKFKWDVAAEKLVAAIRENSVPPSALPGATAPSATTSTGDALALAFKNASSALLHWPQTLRMTKTWIERPEFDQVLAHARTSSNGVMVLLGPPGSGKSALLGKVAHLLLEEGVAVLAIKADRLPNTVQSRAHLAADLGLPGDIAKSLAALADLKPTVLIIDQLDALGDLVDLKTERLSVLLELVHDVAQTATVPVLLSSRAFDFRHDTRFRRLNAVEQALSAPDVARVSEILTKHEIAAGSLSPRLKELLRTPQALDVFLQVQRSAENSPAIDSYQRMLEALWSQQLASEQNPLGIAEVAGHVAHMMMTREELWLTRTLLSAKGYDASVMALLRAGILVEDMGRVAFAHQTLFEFARARAFVLGDESLVDYVVARQHALFVRPTLWTSLTYLRAVDGATYRSAIEALWRRSDVRKHVQMLLLDFLGQVDAPDEREVALIVSRLDEDVWRGRTIRAITGRQAWFEVLRKTHLPALARGKDAALLVELMTRALEFSPVETSNLLDAAWGADHAKHALLANVLAWSRTWTDQLATRAMQILAEGMIPSPYVERIIQNAIDVAPAQASRLLAAELERQFALAEIASSKRKSDADTESIHELARYDVLEPLTDLLEGAGGLDCVHEVAAADPRAFVEAMSPLFAKIVRCIALPEKGWLTYERDYSSGSSLRFGGHALVEALDSSIRDVAKQDPGFALTFVEKWAGDQTLAVHRLLARALEASLPSSGTAALAYLLGDPRRLVVGDTDDYEKQTSDLIERLAPALAPADAAALEDAVRSSRCLDESAFVPKERRIAIDANQRHRTRLLTALGKEKLPSKPAAEIGREQRRPPSANTCIPLVEAHVVGSPMSTEQMLRAKDEDLLNLFSELNDATRFSHPRHPSQGGCYQASDAFAAAVKQQPERFIPLLSRFRPGDSQDSSETPVAAAVAALADVLPGPRLEGLVLELANLGFFAGARREDISYALQRVGTSTELSEDTCKLLESWLVDDASEKPVADRASGRNDSLLFGMRGGGVLPGGNFPPLLALSTAHLARSKPRIDAWMAMLERHLDRQEAPAVWHALTRNLESVLFGPPARAEAFLNRLFEQFPSVRDSQGGVILIARSMNKLPLSTVERWMQDVHAGTWSRRDQAFGELLVLLATRPNATSKSRERLETELRALESEQPATDVSLGLAHAAARVWSYPEHRDAATEILIRLILRAEGPVAEAVMRAFVPDEALLWDEASRRLLQALQATPNVALAGKGPYFVEQIRQLLPGEAELVADVALAITNEAAKQPGSGYFLTHGEELVDIAMTLQRLGSPAREKGLDLFETLLEQRAYGAHEVLTTLDSGVPANEVERPRRRLRHRKGPGARTA